MMATPVKIYPSILSADFTNLRQSIAPLEELDISGYHIDVMDGHFVPNITFGPWICKTMGRLTQHKLDVHLMIENAYTYISEFSDDNVEAITIHQEANPQMHRVIQSIRSHGKLAGISLNPGTPVSILENILQEVQLVLIMTVNPGFAAQQFLPFCIDKIRLLSKIRHTRNLDFEIYVDGGIDTDTAPLVISAGARGLIAGNAIFGSDQPAQVISRILNHS